MGFISLDSLKIFSNKSRASSLREQMLLCSPHSYKCTLYNFPKGVYRFSLKSTNLKMSLLKPCLKTPD